MCFRYADLRSGRMIIKKSDNILSWQKRLTLRLQTILSRYSFHLILFLALAIGILYHIPAFKNPYITTDGDITQYIYWMNQFYDNDLFQNDLLTKFARYYTSLGVTSLYYIFSFIIHPYLLSNILAIVLFVAGACYVYKLVLYISNSNAALLAGMLFILSGIFLDVILGAFPRAFGHPLIIIFLYYLIRKKHLHSATILIMECLFYPVAFLLCEIVYFFSFFNLEKRKIRFSLEHGKIKYFAISTIICLAILTARYSVGTDPLIGSPVLKKEIVGHPEYYESGRFGLTPSPFLLREIVMCYPENATGAVDLFILLFIFVGVIGKKKKFLSSCFGFFIGCGNVYYS